MTKKTIAEYRQLAAVAQRRADRASSTELKRSYRQLAEGWTKLADHLEAQTLAQGRPPQGKGERDGSRQNGPS